MDRDERRRLRAAYEQPCARRVREENTDPELLRTALRETDLAEWVDDEIAWNVSVGFWNDGVPADKLPTAAFRAIRRPLRQIFEAFGEIGRQLK
jgi:hypothetical protein